MSARLGAPARLHPKSSRVRVACGAGCLLLIWALAVPAGAGPAPERIRWSSGPPAAAQLDEWTAFPSDTMRAEPVRRWRARARQPGFTSGDVLVDGHTTWVAAGWRSRHGTGDSISIVQVQTPERSSVLARFPGRNPSLERLADGSLVLVTITGDSTSRALIVVRRGSRDGRTWSDPEPLGARDATTTLAAGRLARDHNGGLVLPVCSVTAERGTEIVCYRSRDARTWDEMAVVPVERGECDAALAGRSKGEWLLVSRLGTHLRCRVLTKEAVTLIRPGGLAVTALAAPFALRSFESGDGMAIAWNDPVPDTLVALPPLQALRAALSADAGQTWTPLRPLVVRPGRVAVAPALVATGDRITALFVEAAAPDTVGARPDSTGRLQCLDFEVRTLRAPQAWPAPEAKGPYAVDPAAARRALRLLVAHTLSRPAAPRRLFVEGYLARGLAGATAALGADRDAAEWFDAGPCRAWARGFADQLAAHQDKTGYWSIGYGAIYIADIAAALGVFPSLEADADSVQLQRWQAVAEKFVHSLQEDLMVLPSGAFGIGWRNTYVPRSNKRIARDPYLVSTALAGIELHGWLWKRTGNVAYRDCALHALEYTLAQLKPDGSLPEHASGEGALTTAAYVEEGWMAADVFLGDSKVLERLRAALPAHVQWLLSTQHRDGTWDSGANGEFARTPAIVNFLIWYDQRCRHSEGVRQAIRRASVPLLDPGRWRETGLFDAGYHHEVQRAHSLRALVALVTGTFIL